MIEQIQGEFLESGPGHLLVRVGGIGVRVSVPRSVTSRLEGRAAGTLWTRLLIRDGEPHLYGFDRPEERTCFDALLQVSGVGPRIALAILSFLEPDDLALEAERGAIEALTQVPGVGRKLASRIVLELKGKLPAIAAGPRDRRLGGETGTGLAGDALRALLSLGYPAEEAREAVRVAMDAAGSDSLPLDRLLRESLTILNRGR